MNLCSSASSPFVLRVLCVKKPCWLALPIAEEGAAQRADRGEERREQVEVAVVADAAPVGQHHAGPAAPRVPARPEPRVAVASAAILSVEARDGVALAGARRLEAEVLALVRPVEG